MNRPAQLVAGFLLGVSLALWMPSFLSLSGIYAPEPEWDAPNVEINEPQPETEKMVHSTRSNAQGRKSSASVAARIVVSETLRTGDPRHNNREVIEIEGDLPKNLHFSWIADPAHGLSPAFLWEKAPGQFYLGTERIPRQDGDVLSAYAFEAPAVIPDQHEGRLIFHRRVFERLLAWSQSLPTANPEIILVRVERADPQTVRIYLPAVASSPETVLRITL